MGSTRATIAFALLSACVPPPRPTTATAPEPAVAVTAVAEPARLDAPPELVASSSREEALAALLAVHRAPRPAPALVEGAVALPTDWKTLPSSAVLWRSDDPYPFTTVPIGDVVLTLEHRFLMVRDARTGTVRWNAALVEGTTADPYFGAGCDTAVTFETTGITGYDLETGAVRWTFALTPPSHRSGRANPGSARVAGCVLAVRLTPEQAQLADFSAAARLRLLDTRTGAILLERNCVDTCDVRDLDATSVLVEDADALVRVPVDGSTESVIADGPCVYPHRSSHDDSALHGDVCLRIARGHLERVSTVGDVLWSLGLPADAHWELLAVNGAHALLGARAHPVVIDVVPATGVLASIRIRPIGGDVILGGGDIAYFAWYQESVAVDLSLDAPPIREAETLAEDVARSIHELAAPVAMNPPFHLYPVGSRQARTWLLQLLPLVGDVLVARASELPAEDLLGLLPILGHDATAPARAAVLGILGQTYVTEPTLELARVRSRAADAVAIPLAAHDADALADATIAWLDWVAARGALLRGPLCDDDSAPCQLDAAALAAVAAGRDLLDAASLDPAPGARVRLAIARHAPDVAAVTCTPTEDDLAIAAALRTLFELHASLPALALAGDPCLDVRGLAGRVAPREGPGPSWSVGDMRTVSTLTTGHPEWDGAEQRTFSWSWYAGPLEAEGGHILVARVGGVWRTMLVTHEWVS